MALAEARDERADIAKEEEEASQPSGHLVSDVKHLPEACVE